MFKASALRVALITLLTLQLCHAISPSTATIHGSSVGCRRGSAIEDCLEEDFDFIVSEATTQTITFRTANFDEPLVDCGRGKSSKSCLPNPFDSKVAEKCYSNAIFTQNRSC